MIRYKYVPDIINKRQPYRQQHLQLLQSYVDKKQCLLGGALDSAEYAYIVFNVNDKNIAEDFVKNDPYVINKLVTDYNIDLWNVVIGSACSQK